MDRSMVRHVQRISQTSNTREFRGRDSQTSPGRLLDQFSSGVGLSAVHTRTSNHHSRRGLAQRCLRSQRAIGDVLDSTVFIANKSYDFEFDGIAETRVMTGAITNHTTHVQEVKLVPGFNLSLIHISEPTRLLSISYAVFCLKK